MNQNQAKTIGVTGLSGAFVVLLLWGAGSVGVVIPPEAQEAITTLITAAAAYVAHKEGVVNA